MTVAEAYAACEEITRTRAANFFFGIRLLPADKRRAMCAVYALARRIDDVGDGDLPAAEKRAGLGEIRSRLPTPERCSDDPVLVAIADARDRCALPMDAFADLVDGVQSDVDGGPIETFDELVVYCRRVAGSIGRLCLAVFGCPDRPTAMPLADDLGVALQLTNILRDVREDLDAGRMYLPRTDLERFGCRDGLDAASPEAVEALVRFEAARAREWYERGLELLTLLDVRSAACVATMSGIYGRILARIERSPGEVMARRLRLPVWEKCWVALRSVATAGLRARRGRGPGIMEVAG